MKLREYYIKQYRTQKRELFEQNELWRLCVSTEEKFTEKLDDIIIKSLFFDYINDFHRENSLKAQINLLLQRKRTHEEIMENQKKIEKEKEISDKKYIPYIKEQLKILKTPLEWDDIVRIYKWIWRNQIKFDDLNSKIQLEFKNTKQYKRLKLENKL